MERVKQKMGQARRQQKRLQEYPQVATEFSSVGRKPTLTIAKFAQHLTKSNDRFLFFGGTAAIIAIVVMAWWAKPDRTPDDSSMIALKTAEAAQAGQVTGTQPHSSDFQEPGLDLDHLNERMELLADKITNLEVKFTRVLVLADSITAIENKLVTATQQNKPVYTGAKSAFDTMEPTASGAAHTIPDTAGVFTPTHSVQAMLNLRPSASLNTTPITTLKVGSKVEYINEVDDWYYVNTQTHGKGWCASSYLAPLL